MSKDDGGPAFPGQTGNLVTQGGGAGGFYPEWAGGMSLRDYFAAAALRGICTNKESWRAGFNAHTLAYCLADGMLAERAK